MASVEQVKCYLAQWFHLGKKVIVGKTKEAICPNPVIVGDHYSSLFEDYWQEIFSVYSADCYLEGTQETIKELLSYNWDINSCYRCQMLIPIKEKGLPNLYCPCFDLSTWPNLNLPIPHSPINNKNYLYNLKLRLNKEYIDN